MPVYIPTSADVDQRPRGRRDNERAFFAGPFELRARGRQSKRLFRRIDVAPPNGFVRPGFRFAYAQACDKSALPRFVSVFTHTRARPRI